MNYGLLPLRPSTRLGPINSFEALQTEMNRLFDSLGYDVEHDFAQLENSPTGVQHKANPHVTVDLKDTGEEFVLVAELCGMDLNDIILATTPHYVSLSGEKKNEEATHDERHYRQERHFGFFRRVIHLPCEIDTTKVDAVYKDGVLRISLPKTKQSLLNEKKINVKAG